MLPGGSPAAAGLHLARTICRRAERLLVSLRQEGGTVGEPALRYVNRLSDFLFVASRWVNDQGVRQFLLRFSPLMLEGEDKWLSQMSADLTGRNAFDNATLLIVDLFPNLI